jgi:hypothetical protein
MEVAAEIAPDGRFSERCEIGNPDKHPAPRVENLTLIA